MKSTLSRLPLSRLSIVGVVASALLGLQFAATGTTSSGVANKYIGAAKCKNCHSTDATGNQYDSWRHARHAMAFATLATAEAKRAGAERDVDAPQSSDRCLKCHVTAFGEPEANIKKGFDVRDGVQCESCHGPGDEHLKARFAAAAGGDEDEGFGDEEGPRYTEIPADEIIADPPVATCLGCHNRESPTFREFCYCEFKRRISHRNPLKPRTEEVELECGGCVDGCPGESCGVPVRR